MADIMNTLAQLGRGRFVESLDERMREAVDAVRSNAEKNRETKATVTVTLTVEPLKNDHLGIRLNGSVTSKLPGSPPNESIFFAAADGELVREDPRQGNLLTTIKKSDSTH